MANTIIKLEDTTATCRRAMECLDLGIYYKDQIHLNLPDHPITLKEFRESVEEAISIIDGLSKCHLLIEVEYLRLDQCTDDCMIDPTKKIRGIRISTGLSYHNIIVLNCQAA